MLPLGGTAVAHEISVIMALKRHDITPQPTNEFTIDWFGLLVCILAEERVNEAGTLYVFGFHEIYNVLSTFVTEMWHMLSLLSCFESVSNNVASRVFSVGTSEGQTHGYHASLHG